MIPNKENEVLYKISLLTFVIFYTLIRIMDFFKIIIFLTI